MRPTLQRIGSLVAIAICGGPLSLAAQAPTVTVGGVGYAGYYYNLKDTASHSNNFDVTRAYVNVIGKFAYGVGTRVTADIYRNPDGSLAYRLKYAFATWTPEKSALTFKLRAIRLRENSTNLLLIEVADLRNGCSFRGYAQDLGALRSR